MRVGRARSCLLAVGLLGALQVAQAAPAWVLLVRHAEKAEAAGSDPGLSPAGTTRALALRDSLADFKLDVVLTTPFRRTRDTAAPLVQARDLTPMVVPATGDHVANAVARLRGLSPHSTALVVGHSNTLAGIVQGLGGPRIADLRECDYDALYLLMLAEPPQLIRARYGPMNPACP